MLVVAQATQKGATYCIDSGFLSPFTRRADSTGPSVVIELDTRGYQKGSPRDSYRRVDKRRHTPRRLDQSHKKKLVHFRGILLEKYHHTHVEAHRERTSKTDKMKDCMVDLFAE